MKQNRCVMVYKGCCIAILFYFIELKLLTNDFVYNNVRYKKQEMSGMHAN